MRMHNTAVVAAPAVARALILAGGRARRFGADKTLAALGGRPLIVHAIARIAPQVLTVVISGDPAKYAQFGYPVLPDAPDLAPGPLAGIYTGLAAWPQDDMLAVAADMPFLPHDLAARLASAGHGRGCAYAGDGRRHTLALWWAPGMAPALAAFLRAGGRDIRGWIAACGAAQVAFVPRPDSDVMCNINTPATLAEAEQRIGAAAAGSTEGDDPCAI